MDEPTLEALQKENALLRQRVAELEEERNRARELLQSSFDQVDAVIYLRDRDSRYMLVNSMYVRSLNIKQEDVIGKRDSEVFPREVWEGFRETDRLVIESGEVVEREELVPLSDGVHTFRSLKFPIFDAHGHMYAIGGISTDITEQKRAAAALHKSQSFLEAILENAPMLVYTKDRAGRYLLISGEAARQVNRTRAEVLGKTDRELLPESAADRISENDQRVFASGEPTLVEEVIPQDDGLHTYFNTKFPIRDRDGEIYAICTVATDITQVKRGEEERRRLQEDVITAQKRALRELSTPLLPIADGVVVMPLIGTIDNTRSEQIFESLLNGVTQHRASFTILDVTGVQNIDAHTTNVLLRVAQAVALLGAEIVITGIQPQMARTMATLDIRLDRIRTRSTFQSGIEYALKARSNAQRGRRESTGAAK